MHKIYEKRLLMLRPEEITTRSNGVRGEALREGHEMLARSIAAIGIIQPLAVRKNGTGNYELIAGERRLRAAVAARLRRVPCIVHRIDDCTAELYSVTENMQRTTPQFFTEAVTLEKIMLRYGLSLSETAARLGISPSQLSDKLGVLRLDGEIRKKVTEAALPFEYASMLLKIPPEKRERVLDIMLCEDITPKQAERHIAEAEEKHSEVHKPEACFEKPYRKSAIGDVRLFANSLSKLTEALQSSGITADSKRYETDKYIEYRVRIKKSPTSPDNATQLKIC